MLSLLYELLLSDGMLELSPSESSSQVQSPVLSVSSLSSLDECSPLLSTIPHHEYKSYIFEDRVPAKTPTEQLDARNLLWIMSSVWIGTFCAGLGESYLITAAIGLGAAGRNRMLTDDS